jgi:Zn-dependent peptidase ImmA (M78 family)
MTESSRPRRGALSPVVDEGIADVRQRARRCLAEAEAVLRAIDADYAPPPWDPWLIAQALGIRCIEVDVTQAVGPNFPPAMICLRGGEPVILYRRQKDEARTRFSLFHEIAHTLFPGFGRGSLPEGAGSPLFEPEGQLERLCDAAALEMLLPEEPFRDDLQEGGFGAHHVDALCRRYGAGVEAVALRMVDSDAAPACAVALVEPQRPSRWRARQQPGGMPDATIRYAAYSSRCRQQGWFVARGLHLGRDSSLRVAARSGKLTEGRERLALLNGDAHAFDIEALPLTDRPKHRGQRALLAFLYPE